VLHVATQLVDLSAGLVPIAGRAAWLAYLLELSAHVIYGAALLV
jgi:hypothetical protein